MCIQRSSIYRSFDQPQTLWGISARSTLTISDHGPILQGTFGFFALDYDSPDADLLLPDSNGPIVPGEFYLRNSNIFKRLNIFWGGYIRGSGSAPVLRLGRNCTKTTKTAFGE
jgi:hypothetical protein